MVLMRRIVVRCGGGVWEEPHEQLIVCGKTNLIDWKRDGMSQVSMVGGSTLLKVK
jgi:ribosomal protein S27AE